MSGAFSVRAIPKLITEGAGYGILESVTFVAERHGVHATVLVSDISEITAAIVQLEPQLYADIMCSLRRGKTVSFNQKRLRSDLYPLGFFALSL